MALTIVRTGPYLSVAATSVPLPAGLTWPDDFPIDFSDGSTALEILGIHVKATADATVLTRRVTVDLTFQGALVSRWVSVGSHTAGQSRLYEFTNGIPVENQVGAGNFLVNREALPYRVFMGLSHAISISQDNVAAGDRVDVFVRSLLHR